MIGQGQLQSRIKQLIEDGTFPRFSIFVGPNGSGKKTLALEIAKWFETHEVAYRFMCSDVKIETIRGIIHGAYTTFGGTNIYIIPDADNMSNAAKNALLKVTEEPPNNAYFIMTLEDENNTLETIRSRGTVFHMDRYTPDEIEEYAAKYLDAVPGDAVPGTKWDIVRDLCETPGDVEILLKSNPSEFYDYVQLVVDNIAEVSLANAFKMPSKISLKDGAEGYDLKLFWKAVSKVMLDRAKERGNSKELVKYCDGYSVTQGYLRKLRVKGINKQMLIDCWLIEIRELWR